MSTDMFHPQAVVKAAAARTDAGREIVVDWPAPTWERYTVWDMKAALEGLVAEGIAFQRHIPNGYGGWDNAFIKER